jgi:hypothetical protein
MNRPASLLITATLCFIGGLLCCAGVSWLFKTYIFPPETIQVQGILKFKGSNDPAVSADAPIGFFVESTATDRFYIEGDLLKPYVGSLVQITGPISTVCGPDGYPCYPSLLAKLVIPAPK